MRSFYTVDGDAEPAPLVGEDARVRRFLQVAMCVFWAPCAVLDLWLLWRDGLHAGGFVFGLLFRQSLVFLALWFTVAAAHGLIRGRRGEADPTAQERRVLRGRMALHGQGYVAPTRGNRGQ